jgi:hypothetical protein
MAITRQSTALINLGSAFPPKNGNKNTTTLILIRVSIKLKKLAELKTNSSIMIPICCISAKNSKSGKIL